MNFSIHQINPYIRTALQSVLRAGSTIKQRIIFDYELIYVEEGSFLLRYGDAEYRCRKGDFVLLRPGVSHSFTQIVTDLSQPHIHFDMVYRPQSAQIPISFKDLPECAPEELLLIHKDVFDPYPQQPLVRFANKEQALEVFYQIVREPKASPLLLKSRLLRLLDMLTADNFPDCFSVSSEPAYSIARQLKDYMDAGQGLSAQLSDLEKQFSYSKYHLERQFKKHYGVSLIDYRNRRRMERARELLQQYSVSSVAEQMGFGSIYAFSRAYKNHFGVSPSAAKIVVCEE